MAKVAKQRADILLVQRGLAEGRSKAQALIMSGKVLQNDKPIQKSGDMIDETAELRIKGGQNLWVSRGGTKLSAALSHWNIDVKEMLCADVGSSTGGFCDVLLQAGASEVYAIDVGRGQLHEKLRQDKRIISMEGVNARYLTSADFPALPQCITCDVSFINLQKALSSILNMCSDAHEQETSQKTSLIALIKPQFQLQKKDIGKGGIVKDPALHKLACDEVQNWLSDIGWQVQGIIPSPITGATGNHEFLIYAIT